MKDLSYLENIVQDCIIKANNINIPTGKISSVRINRRAKKRWGMCIPNPNNTFTIEISEILLQDDVSNDALYDTVMHEVLHTAPNCLNHGKIWKKYASMINNAYGMNIKRTTSAEEKNIADMVNNEYKYIIACPICGYQWKYIRYTKCVKYPNRYNHTGCSNEGLIRIL